MSEVNSSDEEEETSSPGELSKQNRKNNSHVDKDVPSTTRVSFKNSPQDQIDSLESESSTASCTNQEMPSIVTDHAVFEMIDTMKTLTLTDQKAEDESNPPEVEEEGNVDREVIQSSTNRPNDDVSTKAKDEDSLAKKQEKFEKEPQRTVRKNTVPEFVTTELPENLPPKMQNKAEKTTQDTVREDQESSTEVTDIAQAIEDESMQDESSNENSEQQHQKDPTKTIAESQTSSLPDFLPKLSVLLANVQSCKSFVKSTELCQKFIESSHDICVITESWLKESDSDSLFTPYGILIHRCDRDDNRNGGGVAILYKRNLIIKKLDIQLENHLRFHRSEILACCVIMPDSRNVSFSLVAVYRPPKANQQETSRLISHLALILPRADYVLLGDFNLPGIYCTNDNHRLEKDTHEFIKFAKAHGMTQHVWEVTHENNILDLVFSSPRIVVNDVNVQDRFVKSDHKSVSFSVTKSPIYEPRTNPSIIKYFPLHDFKTCHLVFDACDFENLNSSILSQNWIHMFSALETNTLRYNLFLSVFVDLVKIFTPKHQEFNEFPIQAFRKQFFAPRKNQNSRTSPNNKKQTIPGLIVKETPISTASKKALRFARHFSSRHPFLNKTTGPLTNSVFTSSHDSQIFSPFVIKNMLEQVTQHFYGERLYCSVLKNCAESLATPLSLIFTKILESGEYPDSWNHCIIIPGIPENRDHIRKPEKYDAQYFFDPFMGVMEKSIFDYLQKEFSQKFSPRIEHPFHSNYSVYFKKHDRMHVIHFKLEHTFNRVSSKFLISKLNELCVDEKICNWFTWLMSKEKTFSVQVNDFLESDKHVFKSGAPRGNYSRSFLFLVFINSLLIEIPQNIMCSACMFSEDLEIYSHEPDIINTSLACIENWCVANELTISHRNIVWYRTGKETKPKIVFEFRDNEIDCIPLNDELVPPTKQIFFELSETFMVS